MNISNYPNPIFERENWIDLNGVWDFGFQKAKRFFKFSKNPKELIAYKNKCDKKITVPFCLESELSGIGYTDFVNLAYYKKTINVSKENSNVFLHIGGADYITSLFVNDKYVASHTGGCTSFSFDITDYVNDGDNEVFIVCEDDTRNSLVPMGKQSDRKNSYACSYTRTTGIWQNVYLEYTPKSYVKNFKVYPDINQCLVNLNIDLIGKENLTIIATYDGKEVGKTEIKDACDSVIATVNLSEKHLWDLGKGNLYNLQIIFGEDKVISYFGLRNVRLDGFKFMLNNRSVFQRTVLDQGFYKKGIWTAQNDDELVKDIDLSMSVGFNGARLHQKVFDPRFLYFCDLKGYMVWGEYASWGIDYSNPKAVDIFLSQWAETVNRDFNHPAIIGWCPFNETWNYRKRKQYDPVISTAYHYTKSVDNTRPCIDTSGNFHVVTDIYDLHDYRFKYDEFKESYDKLVTEGYLYEHVLQDNPGRQKYNGEPVFMSEYGGIKWETDKAYKSWGYGDDVKTPEEFLDRYKGLTQAILQNEKMLGFCYTQLYDVEQEQNGLFTYEREKKFDDSIYESIKEINTAIAKIEE